jgi:hypothetical protein
MRLERPTVVWLEGIWRELKRAGMSEVCMVQIVGGCLRVVGFWILIDGGL